MRIVRYVSVCLVSVSLSVYHTLLIGISHLLSVLFGSMAAEHVGIGSDGGGGGGGGIATVNLGRA